MKSKGNHQAIEAGLLAPWRVRHRRRVVAAVIVCITALLLVTRTHGQAISLASFTQSQGLGSLEDNCLVQDRRGFVYACTENGLFIFDGRVFQRIGAANGLTGSFIGALHQDAAGRLWVGTRTGLFVGDGQHFTNVTGPASTLSVDPGATLADLDGQTYAVSEHQLWRVDATGTAWRARPRFDAAALRATPRLADISSVFTNGHALWFGCGKSLCQLTGETLHVWSEHEGIPADTWTSYLTTPDGTLWARSPRYIRALAKGSDVFVSHDLPHARVVTAYLDMVEDDQGRVLTRADNGLARWDGHGWRIFDASNGLPDIGIDALLYDRSHVLWMGTYGRGVLQWRGYDQFQSWQAAQGLDSSPSWAIARDTNGTLWLGNELGGSVLAPGASRLTPWPLKPPPLAQETIGLHALPAGDMLVTYYSGEVLRYHAKTRRTEQVLHSPAYIRDMLVDNQGAWWLCTERGLYMYDGHTLKRAGEGIVPDTPFSDAKEDAQGRLWFAGDAGLFRFAHGRWTHVHVVGAPSDRSFLHVETPANGDFYVAGNFNGLWQGHATDEDTLPVVHVGDDLLDHTRVYFIRHDRRGWLWIGGTDGVELFDGKRWRRLTEDDGLIWDDIAENGFFEDSDDSVWIGTSNGVSHVLHPELLVTDTSLRVVITDLRRGGETQATATSYSFNEQPKQPLTLNLATLGAPTRSNLQYRYRLRGLERDWVNSDRPQVDYPPLPSGDYVFEVAVYDPDNRQTSPIVQLPLQIVPPWWRRAPALLGVALLLALAIVLMWHIRTRHLRARARALERLVASRTHELEVDKQALEETRAALWQQANHDALTGLPSRSRVLEILALAITNAQQRSLPLAVALIDLDHFKQINDRHGHLAGDAVLLEVATRLRNAMPSGATLGRFGGEEILLVVPGPAVDDRAPFEALRQHVATKSFVGDGTHVDVTCSIGVTWLRPHDSDSVDLIRRADAALYAAKTAGRNRVVIDDEWCETV